jgi:hypothetical protein
VDNLTIDHLTVDTNRDGSRFVPQRPISNVTVNAPSDDAIVLKTSLALARSAALENDFITNWVSGLRL